MFNVRKIIRDNDKTFYNFNTRKKRSQALRYVAVCLVGFLAAILFPKVSDDLLVVVLVMTVQSILLGFAANIIVLRLMGREKETPESTSIEAKVRSKKLRDLCRELSYNISYLNLIAIAFIPIPAVLLLPTPEVPGFLRGSQPVEVCIHWLSTSGATAMASTIIRGTAMFVFYAVPIEVLFSIIRVIGRLRNVMTLEQVLVNYGRF